MQSMHFWFFRTAGFIKLRVFHIEDELMLVRSGIRVKLGSRRERRP
jgi:hypothetical protein